MHEKLGLSERSYLRKSPAHEGFVDALVLWIK